MTQKQMLMRALEYAEIPFYRHPEARKAARALLIILWLHDINWHAEAETIEARARGLFPSAFKKLEDAACESRLGAAASFLGCLHGWGLIPKDWRATQGDAFVNELWETVNAPVSV